MLAPLGGEQYAVAVQQQRADVGEPAQIGAHPVQRACDVMHRLQLTPQLARHTGTPGESQAGEQTVAAFFFLVHCMPFSVMRDKIMRSVASIDSSFPPCDDTLVS